MSARRLHAGSSLLWVNVVTVAVAIALGLSLGRGEIWPIGVFGLGLVAAVSVINPRIFGFMAVATTCLVPTDWLTGHLVGVEQASLPRLILIAGLGVVVAEALRSRGHERRTSMRAEDWMVVLYAAVTVWGIRSYDPETRRLFEYLILIPVAEYLVVRFGGLDERDLRWLARAFVVLAGLLAMTVFADWIAGRALFLGPRSSYLWAASTQDIFRPGGVFADPPRAATVLVTAFSLLPVARTDASRRMKGLLTLASILVVSGVAITFTRSTWIALTVAILGMVWFYRGAITSVVLAAAGAGGAYLALEALAGSRILQAGVLRPETVDYRRSLYSYALAALRDVGPVQQLFGTGILATRQASFGAAFSLAHSGTHNSFITMLAEHGVLGLIAFAGMLLAMGYSCARSVRTRGKIDYAVSLGLVVATLGLASIGYETVRAYAVMSAFFLAAAICVTLMDSKESAPHERPSE